MHRPRLLFIPALAVLLCLTTAGIAGTENASARDIISAAHQAAGGEAWIRPQTLVLQGRAVLYGDGQMDRRTVADEYRMWRVFPDWDESARQASGKVRIDAFSDDRVLFQLAFDGEHSYNQQGRVAESEAGQEWSAAFGFGIIRFALDEGFSLTRLADDQVEGHATYVVLVSDPEGDETLFWIDQADHAIRKVGFDTPRGWHERIYSDFEFHDQPRFQQPTRVRLYYNGRLTNNIHWQNYSVNRPIPDEVFVIEPEAP